MSAWLDPLRRALDAVPAPVTFFFRDDDAGWDDQRLLALLEVFETNAVPVDLAAIPTAMSSDLALALRARIEAAPQLVAVHQHGFAHVNHERDGRRYEFGPARPAASQWRDIDLGRRRLVDMLGPLAKPIFTPPWNRCTAVTGECLRELGFIALSRDAGARPLEIDGLCELPIRMDWAPHRKGKPVDRRELARLLSRHLQSPGPTGVMFHHALMDVADRAAVSELLGLLATHPRSRCRPMMALPWEPGAACAATTLTGWLSHPGKSGS